MTTAIVAIVLIAAVCLAAWLWIDADRRDYERAHGWKDGEE
jgi:hypothetical protein